ncbi:hypothetical protein CTI12_AA414750 [Artemisia annua]|uniref:Uncharacterized protein n=1 Tax=Artemisia annua TaxID=35608 RepID=A0A2U1M6I2_ARTAN|nr:hypothetical protein CTI12_AA414750 [Artemisia annua]
MHPGKRKDYDSNNTAGRKDNKVLKNSTGDVSQADLDKQKGSSQHAAAATNVTPRVILEDRRVNCSSSPMNDSEVIDMTRRKEKKGELMRNYQSGQTSTNMTNGIHLPGRTNRAGATNISSRLTFESNNAIRGEPHRLLPSFDAVMTQESPTTCDNQDEDPYDFIYHGVPKQHRVLKEEPPCVFCGAKRINLADLGPLDDYRVTLNASVEHDQRNYNLPTTSEVAGIWVEGNNNITAYKRSIVVYWRSDYPTQIQPHWASYDPLSYVLFFPNGDPGWHSKIPRVGVSMDEIIGERK